MSDADRQLLLNLIEALETSGRLNGGEPQQEWCPNCSLPSLQIQPLTCLDPDGVRPIGAFIKCTNCSPDSPRYDRAWRPT